MRVAVVDAGPSLLGGALLPYAQEVLAGKAPAKAAQPVVALPRVTA
jgi:hypothetical protein